MLDGASGPGIRSRKLCGAVTGSKGTGHDPWRVSTILRLHRALPPAVRQIGSFAAIGVVSTLAYVVLFALFRGTLPATLANAAALLLTAIGNTAANRRLTFGVKGRDGLGRHHVGGLVAFLVALAITTASIAALQVAAPRAGRLLEVSVLVAANVLATTVRFVLLRTWIDPRPVERAGS